MHLLLVIFFFCTFYSANYCDDDDKGVRHMILCRVIMGKMELVHPGSKQFHPSNEEFDSGVDDLQNPRHYIVWNMNINSHVYPECVVSFKIPSEEQGDLPLHISPASMKSSTCL